MIITDFAKDVHLFHSFEGDLSNMLDYGDSATVYKVSENVVAKVFKTNFQNVEKEFYTLLELSGINEIVKPYALDQNRNIIFMERIYGDTLNCFDESDILMYRNIIPELVEEIKIHGYTANDLNDDNIIITYDGGIRIIDVEYYNPFK